MKFLKTGLLLLASLGSTSAFAGTNVTVIYQPAHGAVSAPTLSGVMLLVLGLLLAAVAIRMLKQHQSGMTMLVGVFAVAGLMSGATGISLMSDANAVAIPNNEMSSPTGGQVSDGSVGNGSSHDFENTSGVALRITDISVDSIAFSCGPAAANGCVIGNTYQPAEVCALVCTNLTAQ